MDTPASSDYIEMKKRKAIATRDMQKSSANYTTQKQFAVLQNTNTYTNDLRVEPLDRFQILFPFTEYFVKLENERKY